MRGRTLKLLKQLIRDGYVIAKTHTSSQFRTLQKHFPTIQRGEIEHKVIYYFEDKNKIALQALFQRTVREAIYQKTVKLSFDGNQFVVRIPNARS